MEASDMADLKQVQAELLGFMAPDAVVAQGRALIVQPKSAEEISKVLQVANRTKTPVRPRGGGSNWWSSTAPPEGGILLWLGRMNDIVKIDEGQMTVTAQGGTPFVKIDEALRETGFKLKIFPESGGAVPCMMECPAHMNPPEYINLIAKGQYEEAIRRMKETNPLPLVCGRICPRTCETKCRRNHYEGPVGINYLKRFVADVDIAKDQPYLPSIQPATGKRAAIIGAGPAGLTAAWFLARAGHRVTIFERREKPGGMLRYGLPAYRIPRELLDAEIAVIQSLGVEMQFGIEFGRDVTVEGLKTAGFDAVLLAVGSQIGCPLGLPGEEACSHVSIGLNFMNAVNSGTAPDFTGRNIAVIGGGNVAMDSARTALRLGAKSVEVLCREDASEMPAAAFEIEAAKLEGIAFTVLTDPVGLVQTGDAVSLTFTKIVPGTWSAPVAVPGTQYTAAYDHVISAVGQTQELSFISPDCALTTEQNRVAADPNTLMTNIDGLFAAGDVVTGMQSAIQAIAAGRRAAVTMGKYMLGQALPIGPTYFDQVQGSYGAIDYEALFDLPKQIAKVAMPTLTEAERRCTFKEVELGLTEAEARREALRCFSCNQKLGTLAGHLQTWGTSPFSSANAEDQHTQIMGVKVVLPTGEIVTIGTGALKNALGQYHPSFYPASLATLYVGSEGAFGVIAEATLKIYPYPEAMTSHIATFESSEETFRFLAKVVERQRAGGLSTLMEVRRINGEAASHYFPQLAGKIPENASDYIMLTAEGYKEDVDRHLAQAFILAQGNGGTVIAEALSDWWDGRFTLATAHLSKGRRVMICAFVPFTLLPEVLALSKKYEVEFGLDLGMFGYPFGGPVYLAHAVFPWWTGDEESHQKALYQAQTMMKALVDLGCAPQRVGNDFLDLTVDALEPSYVDFVKRLKHALDPNGIMNPGVIVKGK